MAKFFIPSQDLFHDKALIRGRDVHHIRHVLRLKPGDEVTINYEGRADFRARIDTISASEVRLQVLEQLASPFQNKNSITLVQGIPKHAKMDLILQKATELGVEEIIPLASSRSFVNEHRGVSEGRRDRWQKICQEAAKQCGRSAIPKLHLPIEFPALCSRVAKEQNILPLLLWEKEQQRQLKSVLTQYKNAHDSTDAHDNTDASENEARKVFILVGPEGGFCVEEVQMALQAGFISISCAPWILRSETAALYVLSAVQYELNFP